MTTERAKTYDRLSVDDAVLVMIDYQSGLAQMVRDQSPEEFCNNVAALADTAKLLKLPVVITTVGDKGPPGPLMPELRERFPKAPLIRREGEFNAWDNQEFVKAIKKTGRRQIILAGIGTDSCVAPVALSAIQAGYQVSLVIDASGSMDKMSAHAGMGRVALAGGQPITWFAVLSELARDWRTDEKGLTKLISEHVPTFRALMVSHEAKKS